MGQYVTSQWVCGLELPVIAAKTIFIVETVILHSHLSANIILLIFMVFVMCYVSYSSTIAKILTEVESLLQIGDNLKYCAVCRYSSLGSWSVYHEKTLVC